MDLPVELWMRVFEHVHTSVVRQIRERSGPVIPRIDTPPPWDWDGNRRIHHGEIEYCARPYALRRYLAAVQKDGDDAADLAAARSLDLFEKQAFGKTRAYYAINRNSRAASIKLRLSKKLFCSYTDPPHTFGNEEVPFRHKLLEHYKQFTPRLPLVLEIFDIMAHFDETDYSREDIREYLHEEEGGLGSRVSNYSRLLDGFDHVKLLASPFLDLFLEGTTIDSQLILEVLKEAIEKYRENKGLPSIKIEMYV
ncbi:hypothetical protein Q7P37_005611 [Cladosporium fusiforme]